MSRTLQFQRGKSPSIGPKAAIAAWYIVCAAAAASLTLAGPAAAGRPGDPGRQAALLLYIGGSYLGTASEHARHVWKARPENAGRLYTEGLFRHSRHVNYFGDLLVFGGFGLLTRQAWTAAVPLAMAVNFALVIIPAHDAYLAERYGQEFDAYARRTKKLIPFLY